MFRLQPCLKQYSQDLDKAASPEETVYNVRQAFSRFGTGILQTVRRIDSGRLGIPVYLSVCGEKARSVMPARKQMGKGASPKQAEASALMEMAERFSLFSFLAAEQTPCRHTWSEAQKQLQAQTIPLQEVLYSVQEDLDLNQAREIMDLVAWRFTPALDIHTEQTLYLPLDWFKKLNEFNGSSAGNTFEESVLQGACELVERHVSAIVDFRHPELPSIDPQSFKDPVLLELYSKFQTRGIRVWLKDFSLDLGLPSVGALAYDPATFPELSEIVFTAGTASSPAKAAIRALTEVAQLAGDFETASNYEPSGLSKFKSLQECAWLKQGRAVPLDSLPDISAPDIYAELKHLAKILHNNGFSLYAVDTTHPQLQIPTNYNIAPGFLFRERTPRASLGLFIGRILAEETAEKHAAQGLKALARHYPGSHFLPFFQALLDIRCGRYTPARTRLCKAEKLQPDAQDQALVIFYLAYVHSLEQDWSGTAQILQRAIKLNPEVHAFYNLRGRARFKLKQFGLAAQDFQKALDLDQGSAVDLANLGLCYKYMQKPRAAMEFLEQSLELEPGLSFAAEQLRQIQKEQALINT